MPESTPKKPKWWLNSYFWFTAILILIALAGIIGGEDSIRDPGQTKDRNLVIIYLVGAAIMFAGGYMSHTIALRAYAEELEDSGKGRGAKKGVAVPTSVPSAEEEKDSGEVVIDGPISDIPEEHPEEADAGDTADEENDPKS